MANGISCRREPVEQERRIKQAPSPPEQRGKPAKMEALTDYQRQFAAQQHNLIYAFLNEKGWRADDYYDIAAFGYLRAVKRYLTEPSLQQYAFSTIAWRAMIQSIFAFHRAEERRKAAECAYLATQAQEDPLAELEADLILHDLAAVSSREQYAIAKLRLQGYSIVETALAQGISLKRVRRLMKELYRVYLALMTQ